MILDCRLQEDAETFQSHPLESQLTNVQTKEEILLKGPSIEADNLKKYQTKKDLEIESRDTTLVVRTQNILLMIQETIGSIKNLALADQHHIVIPEVPQIIHDLHLLRANTPQTQTYHVTMVPQIEEK